MNNIISRKIRIAIIGCGRISKSHFDSIEKHNDRVELVAVCDNNQVLLAKHKIEYKVNGYLNLIEMLEIENIDLVAICTPSGMHAHQTEICAKYGIHVMTEKPMATSWHDGLKMVEACSKSGVYLFVVKQNRKNSTLQLLKRAVDENRFGRINFN